MGGNGFIHDSSGPVTGPFLTKPSSTRGPLHAANPTERWMGEGPALRQESGPALPIQHHF